MNRFVKHNLLLIIVISLSLLAAIVLLVWTGIEHAQMTQFIVKTDKLRKEIQTLINQTPAPVQGNLKPLRDDKNNYKEAGDELAERFGRPLQPALDTFIRELAKAKGEEKLTLEEFKNRFRDGWSKIDRTNHAQQQMFYKLFQRNYQNTWGLAMNEFRKTAEKATTEPLNSNSVNDLFLSLLGVPRTFGFDAEQLALYLQEYRVKLLELSGKISIGPGAANFTFDEKGAYTQEQIPLIPRHMDILGDLFSRICKTQIKSVEAIKKRSIEGEVAGDFVRYQYSIEVIGPIAEIRKLVALIDQAYVDNRIYIVKSIFLYEVVDEADAIMRPADLNPTETTAGAEQQPMIGRGRGRRGAAPMMQEPGAMDKKQAELLARQKMEAERQRNLEPTKRRDYGVVVVGSNTDCRAVIDITYVMRQIPQM